MMVRPQVEKQLLNNTDHGSQLLVSLDTYVLIPWLGVCLAHSALDWLHGLLRYLSTQYVYGSRERIAEANLQQC